jgi:hypothetical protein
MISNQSYNHRPGECAYLSKNIPNLFKKEFNDYTETTSAFEKICYKKNVKEYKKGKFNHYILKWTKIRKQKDRRRRRTLIKLYRLERLRFYNLQRSA